ncbi:MAG: hypothetical protein LBD58_02040, partial [Treponema sp.]|nr:hypothetical protein [Treponema sp.]
AFEFVKDEDLLKDRAERDVKLYAIRWRPKKAYIEREYEIPEEDFDIFDIAESAGRGMEDRDSARRFASCPCGCEAHFATPYRGQSKPIERLFGTIIQLFSKSQDFYTGSNGEASERSRHA